MKRIVSIVSLLLLFVLSCQNNAPLEAPQQSHRCPTTAPVITLSAPKAEEVSFEQLMRLLPKRPVVVGFDVDETLIDSTPAFNALQPWYDPEVIRPPDYSKLTTAQKVKYHEFWTRLDDEY